MDENSGPVPPERDLLGEPWGDVRDRRGRRRLKWNREVYEKVEHLRAGGMIEQDIADALNCDVKTLRKYFSPELHSAEARVRGDVMHALAIQAKKGNVSACKEVLRRLDEGRAAVPLARRPREPKEEPIGKKAAADRDAATAHADTSWGALLQ